MMNKEMGQPGKIKIAIGIAGKVAKPILVVNRTYICGDQNYSASQSSSL